MAHQIRGCVARLVEARASGRRLARHLSRAQATGIPRRGAAWVFRRRPGGGAVCVARGGGDAARDWTGYGRGDGGDAGVRIGERVLTAHGGGEDGGFVDASSRGGGAARDSAGNRDT